MKLVYPAHSKRNFYFTAYISKFVLDQGYVPLNPFMIFQYFLLDTVDRSKIYQANAALVAVADELWIFGEISDGVEAEINQAKKIKKPIRYFEIVKSKNVIEISANEARLETEER